MSSSASAGDPVSLQGIRITVVRARAIVALAFVVMLANNGFIIAGLTAFDSLQLRDLHLTVGALKVRDAITVLTLGLLVPVVGYLLDRIAVRPIVITGLVTMAIGFLAYPYVQTSAQLYAAHLFLGASQALCGLVAHVVLVSRSTERHRGLALGLVVGGSSLGNALIPAFNGWLLQFLPWRDAIGVGGAVALALIPLVWLIDPKQSGMEPEARGARPAAVAETSAAGNFLRRLDFWLLALTAGTSVFSVLGLALNLDLYAVGDLGLTGTRAQSLLFLLFFASTVAQLLAGALADRWGPAAVHRTALAMMTVGMGMIAAAPTNLIALDVMTFGAGWGANSAMLQMQPVRLFAPGILGRVLGLLAVAETLSAAAAPSLVGTLRDHLGSYGFAFRLLCGITVVATCAVWSVGKERSAKMALRTSS